MVWPMSAEEKVKSPDTIVVFPAKEMTSENKTSSKKYAIAAAVGLLTLVLVIIAILVGLYLFTDAFHKVLSENIQTGKDSSQDTKVDLTSNVVEYNVHSGDTDAQIVDDYNAFLTVIKLDSTCFVTALNVSEKVDLSKFGSKPLENVEVKETINLVRSKVPIPDISFFNSKARSLCKGVSTYWAYRSCINNNGNSLVKRSRQCISICLFACVEYCYES